MTDIEQLKRLAEAATPMDYSSAKVKEQVEITCPYCCGEGNVDCLNIINFDDLPLGVQVFGIGNEMVAAENFIEAFTPTTILSLIARLERAEKALKLSEVTFEKITKQATVSQESENEKPDAEYVPTTAWLGFMHIKDAIAECKVLITALEQKP